MPTKLPSSSELDFYRNLKKSGGIFSTLQEPTSKLSLKQAWESISSQVGISEWELAATVSTLSSIPTTPMNTTADPTSVGRLPRRTAEALCIAPLRKDDNTTVIAISNPFNDDITSQITFIYGSYVRFEVAPPSFIEILITYIYESNLEKQRKEKTGHSKSNEENEIPRLARALMTRALSMRASDLHIQPFVGGGAVRMRIDGILHRLVILPNAVNQSLIRYFKASSKMDPTNNLIAQDGRMEIEMDGRNCDLRLSTLPVTGGGEKLVIRFLGDSSSHGLEKSGLSTLEIQTLRRMASNTSGVVLLCGPTGSGKTTTLYSILGELNNENVSIATIENPVEFKMPGLAQTEVNDKAGLGFANALRSILRQDPDVILIGEIRDAETAQIAMQSALTGHLVFSTLHTNDAPSAIPRLLDLEVLPAILSQTLTGIVSQRLLRRLCEDCRITLTEASSPEEVGFKKITGVTPTYKAVGCDACNHSGYRGRLAITEMLEINTPLTELIGQGITENSRIRAAAEKTMGSLASNASRRIISGDTTVAEAVRAIGRHFWIDLAADYETLMPEILTITSSTQKANRTSQALLLIGEEEAFPPSMLEKLKDSWYQLVSANTPEEAKRQLQTNSHIHLVLVDLPESLQDEELIEYVSRYRVAMAWSRLPAILRTPANHPELEAKLRAAGATSQFLSKETANDDLIQIINTAVSKNADFRWHTNS